MSRPRGAKICAHCLWPGCLTPRPQLPASLRHQQRPPRRVRRQHSKVAVPMLARRWYQCRNPIQKLTCAQPQFNRSLLLLLKPVPLQRRPRQPVAHLHPASRPYQPLTGKHRTRTISQQPLTPITILRCGPHPRVHRKTAIVPTPALPQPSPCSVTRAAQAAPAPAAVPAPAPTPYKLRPPAPHERPVPAAWAPPSHPACINSNARVRSVHLLETECYIRGLLRLTS